MRFTLSLIASFALCAGSKAITIDPSHVLPSFGSNGFNQPLGQTFRADTSSAALIGMSLNTDTDPNIQIEFTLSLYAGEGFESLIASHTALASSGMMGGFLYFDFQGIPLQPGQTYTVGLTPLNRERNVNHQAVNGANFDSYADGHAIMYGAVDPARDFYLRVLDSYEIPALPPPPPARVPEGGGVLYLLIGLGACVALRRSLNSATPGAAECR